MQKSPYLCITPESPESAARDLPNRADSSAYDPANAASSAPARPVSGASQGLSPPTGAIRPYPCAKQPPLNPSARRRLYAIALNNASASFLISPMYRTCQYRSSRALARLWIPPSRGYATASIRGGYGRLRARLDPGLRRNDGVSRAMRYNARAMAWSDEVVESLRAHEVLHAAYVPDAINWSVLAKLEADAAFAVVPATREEEAVGVAAGVYAGGGRAVEDAKVNVVPLERIRRIQQSEPSRGANPALSPWESGYDLARRLRRNLDIGDEPLSDMEKLADALEENLDLLDKAARPVESLARVPMIDGVIHWNDDIPAFAFGGSGHEAGQRFAFCRALGETLTSPSDTLITRARSERQQRNRAFAAEFLAPSDGLMKMVATRPVVEASDIDEMAERFGVSPFVVEHQIENHNLAKVWQI